LAETRVPASLGKHDPGDCRRHPAAVATLEDRRIGLSAVELAEREAEQGGVGERLGLADRLERVRSIVEAACCDQGLGTVEGGGKRTIRARAGCHDNDSERAQDDRREARHETYDTRTARVAWVRPPPSPAAGLAARRREQLRSTSPS
jgi:hypothetical protein